MAEPHSDTSAHSSAHASAPSSARSPGQPVSIDKIVDIKSRRPSATTRERGWSGVTVDLYPPQPDCAVAYPALDHHLICYCPSGRARLVQRRGGAVHDGWISAGVSLLMPAGYESAWEGDSAASARLRVPASLVASAGEQLGPRSTSRIEIRNVFETRDAVIERLAQILLAELERKPHPAQALIADQVSLALAAHLLRSYNAFEPLACQEVPPLGRGELARLTEFIEDNIDRTIGLAELADLVQVSRFHFTRLFKRSTGMTAISFVEQCRIRRAQALILETDVPLTEVALMAGFADQSHFTRRFHRHIGCTPAAFAREHGRRRPARQAAGQSGVPAAAVRSPAGG
ncbi:helix-turn-helix domain-containing protein [Cupriavidus sp. 30B13]|uniref:helix-turn-helix domain-containing protein n=1 Tax=Cupriavidus sp. 30B13 TaxID=3384241 RepID=UPI003B8F03D6